MAIARTTKKNFTVNQGADFTDTFPVVHANGSAFDLTDYNVASQARKNYASSNAVTFSTAHSNTGGVITLSLDNANTATLTPGRMTYDIEITSSANVVTRVYQGIVTIDPNMTRV